MAAKICPECGTEMAEHLRARVTVAQCPRCGGMFLQGADRGLLVELENEWHANSGPTTQPIPRITPGMAAPTMVAPARSARSFVDELFG